VPLDAILLKARVSGIKVCNRQEHILHVPNIRSVVVRGCVRYSIEIGVLDCQPGRRVEKLELNERPVVIPIAVRTVRVIGIGHVVVDILPSERTGLIDVKADLEQLVVGDCVGQVAILLAMRTQVTDTQIDGDSLVTTDISNVDFPHFIVLVDCGITVSS
jgi:hypothetical protein